VADAQYARRLALLHCTLQTGVGGCRLPPSTVGIYESADASAANSVAWGAQVIGFRSSERIFADGFD